MKLWSFQAYPEGFLKGLSNLAVLLFPEILLNIDLIVAA